jgi:hypothetical protein
VTPQEPIRNPLPIETHIPEVKQLPPKITHVKSNIVTKYAFATRVGFMPGNPGKQN